jgi:hypothetical protein
MAVADKPADLVYMSHELDKAVLSGFIAAQNAAHCTGNLCATVVFSCSLRSPRGVEDEEHDQEELVWSNALLEVIYMCAPCLPPSPAAHPPLHL